ncbi:TerB family tellurite resistance protein [Leptolyngbya sp. FACHB-261]|uniref:tellurite resistance TerB family protein n=1 Tax=Leptolyngbya sp. FACHB-261 TaxID=2692806 RepID=UPI001684B4EC|nr:TerB family tellurite resistance protein [Leptolyngbya sp. FACHB-261]MBD2099539.1 TerB family tellurite resistance protein [Leptolyngbya sp. FACHB-261]
MTATSAERELLKILIGAAWLDGRIQPEERQYLYHLAHQQGLAEDPEIKPLLYELKAVTKRQCYEWVRVYLGDHPGATDCETLLEAVSALIYSDGEIAAEEARLLCSIQQTADAGPLDHLYENLLHNVRALYRNWISKPPNQG